MRSLERRALTAALSSVVCTQESLGAGFSLSCPTQLVMALAGFEPDHAIGSSNRSRHFPIPSGPVRILCLSEIGRHRSQFSCVTCKLDFVRFPVSRRELRPRPMAAQVAVPTSSARFYEGLLERGAERCRSLSGLLQMAQGARASGGGSPGWKPEDYWITPNTPSNALRHLRDYLKRLQHPNRKHDSSAGMGTGQ